MMKVRDGQGALKQSVPVYELRRARRIPKVWGPCAAPEDAVRIAKVELKGLDRERLLALYLSAQNVVVGLEIIAIGAENSCAVTMTAIFRGAVVAGAKGIILAHNHPGGDPKSSEEDRGLLKKVKEAGVLLGCELVDFLIIGDGDVSSDMESILGGLDEGKTA